MIKILSRMRVPLEDFDTSTFRVSQIWAFPLNYLI